jgi:hypothetical protein
MRAFLFVGQFALIVFNWLSSVIATITNFRVFEVPAESFEVFEDLMREFPRVTCDDGLMGLILPILSYLQLVENCYDKNSSFSHS